MIAKTRRSFQVTARNYCLSLGHDTKIMGILNLTPDSFSGDGQLAHGPLNSQKILEIAQKQISDGADILDIGGESTRPGSRPITPQEEITRVIPAIKVLAKKIKQPISIDTYKEEVAEEALDAGASIVNNIMGTTTHDRLLKIIKKYHAAVVLMHMRGIPQTMQTMIHYDNLIAEIITALRKSIEKCLEIGIKSDKIIIDPGIGFSKTVGHNLEIINRLNEFQTLKVPILIGPSRKSFIGKILNNEVSQRLVGTASAVSACILNGAHVIRVHDVKEMKEAACIADGILNFKTWSKE